MTMPAISVIIPAYNSARTIAETLRSLQNQDCKKPFEVIVVDDGSRDNTVGEAKKFGKSGVKVVKQRHGGPAKARNTGAKEAMGGIIMFTDADCVPESSWVREMAMPFSDRSIAGVQGIYRTRQKGIAPLFAQAEIEQRYDRMAKERNIDFIGSYSAAYMRGLFLELKGFDESFPAASGEDPELSFRLAKAGHKMVFNPNAVVYHTHPESVSKYLRTRYYRGYWGRLLYKKHPDKRGESSYKSKSFFWGIGLTCLLTLLLALWTVSVIIRPETWHTLLIPLILLAGTVIHESMGLIAKDKRLFPSGLFIVFLRNLAIGIGIVAGMAKIR